MIRTPYLVVSANGIPSYVKTCYCVNKFHSPRLPQDQGPSIHVLATTTPTPTQPPSTQLSPSHVHPRSTHAPCVYLPMGTLYQQPVAHGPHRSIWRSQ